MYLVVQLRQLITWVVGWVCTTGWRRRIGSTMRSMTQTHLIVEFVTNVASFCAPLAAGVKELDYVVCGKVLV